MLYIKTILLAIVEGLTEFIPVSSTGHLIVVQRWIDLGLGAEFTNAFLVAIQLPAILAVVVYFWSDLWPFGKGDEHTRATFSLWTKVVVGVLPAVVLGLLFDDFIDAYLFWELPVAAALLVGGILLIAIESRGSTPRIESLAQLGYRVALAIGFFQCLAMFPGTSRSAATIIGAMILGASRPVAAEFSFFLAIPTMLGATTLKLVKHGGGFTTEQWMVLGLGSVVSFIVAYLSVAFLMNYIRRHDFKVFGWYRIVLAVVVAAVYFATAKVGEPIDRPERHGIVSCGPHLTETLFALGVGDRVVGVTRYCDYPAEAIDLPKVGGYLDPDLEAITLIQPEMIVLPGQSAQLSAWAKAQDIPILNVHMDNLETIRAGIFTLGEAVEREAAAASLWSDMELRLSALNAALEAHPTVKVLIITSRTSHDLNTLHTTGNTSFVSEMVTAAGGENLFADENEAYFEASKETVVLREPDVILEFHAGETLSDSERERFVRDWDGLTTLPAVQQGRIFLVTESYALRPGPRIVDLAEQFARWFHPDADLPES